MVSGGQCDDHTVVSVTHGDTGLTRHNTEVQSGVRLTSDDTCQLQQRYDDEQRRHGNIVDNLQAQVITHMLTTTTTTTTTTAAAATATAAATAVSFIVCVFLHASPHSEIFS